MTVAERYLLPRNSLLWLVTAQGLAIAPLLLELPFWLMGIWTLVLIWRLQEFRGRWSMPGRRAKAALLSLCVAGSLMSFGRLLGLEPMVALLICAALLKQLEMQRRRDALLLIYLTLFLIGVQFLFSQTLLACLYGAACLWCTLSAWLSMHQPTGHARPARSLRLAGRMCLHTIPLMILLFLVMPRVGSLWSVPNPTQAAKTGVSDSMSPGDFSSLSRTGGVAFRVSFDREPPPRDQLYWRGLVFSAFDGRRWTQSVRDDVRGAAMVDWQGERPSPWRSAAQSGSATPVSYSIVMEASHQRWLYSLMVPVEFEPDPLYGLTRDFNLLRRDPLHQRVQYQVVSQLDYTLEAESLSEVRRARELQLPPGFNSQTLARAREWRLQADSDQAYIDQVLAFFRNDFFYTLEPPLLGRDSVDEFLWQHRRGFCEHFASSFVVLMRAAGIPARVVAGYLGGEYNAGNNYLVVHQYDAHAWAEVWLEGQGWVRVDPTAAVAPERVLRSLGDLQSDLVEGTMSLGRYRQFPWVARLRMEWDAVNYRWYQTVISFDRDAQSKLLNRWLNGVSPLKLMLAILGGGGVVLAVMSLHLWWPVRARPKPPALRYGKHFEHLLLRGGWTRQPGEPMGAFAARVRADIGQSAVAVSAEQRTRLDAAVGHLAGLFEQEQYAGKAVTVAQWRQGLIRLRAALRGWPRRLAGNSSGDPSAAAFR